MPQVWQDRWEFWARPDFRRYPISAARNPGIPGLPVASHIGPIPVAYRCIRRRPYLYGVVIPRSRWTGGRDADERAARQKAKLLEQRNLTKQRLTAARETEHLEEEINKTIAASEAEKKTCRIRLTIWRKWGGK